MVSTITMVIFIVFIVTMILIALAVLQKLDHLRILFIKNDTGNYTFGHAKSVSDFEQRPTPELPSQLSHYSGSYEGQPLFLSLEPAEDEKKGKENTDTGFDYKLAFTRVLLSRKISGVANVKVRGCVMYLTERKGAICLGQANTLLFDIAKTIEGLAIYDLELEKWQHLKLLGNTNENNKESRAGQALENKK